MYRLTHRISTRQNGKIPHSHRDWINYCFIQVIHKNILYNINTQTGIQPISFRAHFISILSQPVHFWLLYNIFQHFFPCTYTLPILWEMKENRKKKSSNKHLCWFFFRCLHGSLLSLWLQSHYSMCEQHTLQLQPIFSFSFWMVFSLLSLFNFCKVLFFHWHLVLTPWHSHSCKLVFSCVSDFWVFLNFFSFNSFSILSSFLNKIHFVCVAQWYRYWIECEHCVCVFLSVYRFKTIKVHENCQLKQNQREKGKSKNSQETIWIRWRNWNCLFQSKNSNWTKSNATRAEWFFFSLRQKKSQFANCEIIFFH